MPKQIQSFKHFPFAKPYVKNIVIYNLNNKKISKLLYKLEPLSQSLKALQKGSGSRAEECHMVHMLKQFFKDDSKYFRLAQRSAPNGLFLIYHGHPKVCKLGGFSRPRNVFLIIVNERSWRQNF